MIETYKMWKMVRLIKRYQHQWIYNIKTESDEKQEEKNIHSILEILKRKEEPSLPIVQVSLEYLRRYKKDFHRSDTHQGKIFMSEAQSIIVSCQERGYIKWGNNESFINITCEGKRFSEFTGLLNTWVREGRVLFEVVILIVLLTLVFNVPFPVLLDVILSYVSKL